MMKNTKKIYFVLLFCFSIFAFSQSVIKRDTISGTELIMEMDTPINDALAMVKKKCEVKKTSRSYTSTATKKRKGIRTKRTARTLTRAEICRRNPKMSGYKIMVGVRRNSKDANVLRAKFRRSFPRMKAMMDASLRPNYKVLAGSFINRKSGTPYLRRVRRVFPSATLVTYQVYCVDAK